MSAQRKTIVDLGRAIQDELQARIRTVVPASIVTYNPVTQSAAVQPAPQARTAAGEVVPLAQIPDAPVVFPGGGGWTLSWAMLPGDPVLVLCSDRGIDLWRQTGAPFAPEDGRKHRIADAFVFPGAGPAPDPTTGLSATDLLIHGPAGIALRVTPAGTIALAEPGLPVARVGDLVAPDASMTAWIAAVSLAVSTMAAAFNAAPAGTPLVSLGPGGVVPPGAPADFGVVSTGSAQVTSG